MLIGRQPVVGLTSGGDQPLPGTGLAVPAGVEAVLEYNGVYFNDRSGVEVIRVLEIDGLHDADIRDSREVNPGYHGETAFDAYYGGRTLTLSGRIEAFSLAKMRDMQQGFRQAFNTLKEMPLVFHTNVLAHDHFITCRKLGTLTMSDTQQNYQFRYHRDFQLTLRASNPRFLSNALQFATIPHATPSDTLVVNNLGNFTAQPIIRLYDMTDPSIVNLDTGDSIDLTAVIGPAEMYEIDVARKTIKDQSGNNHFDRLDLTSEWFELNPSGPTSLQITSSARGATARMDVLWRHSWM